MACSPTQNNAVQHGTLYAILAGQKLILSLGVRSCKDVPSGLGTIAVGNTVVIIWVFFWRVSVAVFSQSLTLILVTSSSRMRPEPQPTSLLLWGCEAQTTEELLSALGQQNKTSQLYKIQRAWMVRHNDTRQHRTIKQTCIYLDTTRAGETRQNSRTQRDTIHCSDSAVHFSMSKL